MKKSKIDEVEEIILAYNKVVLNINAEAKEAKNGRTYGGIVRAGKGRLVEAIGRSLIQISWKRLKQDPSRLNILRKQFKIPIKMEYIESLRDEGIKEYIKQNINQYYYAYTPDIIVSIDDEIVLVMECKAYTENAMLKRILVDFTLLKSLYPTIKFILLQLESQLGGNYSELKSKTLGSPSTHTLLSYFDIKLDIITLLKGERKVDQPIHKPEFFKPLTRESLENAITIISTILKSKVRR